MRSSGLIRSASLLICQQQQRNAISNGLLHRSYKRTVLFMPPLSVQAARLAAAYALRTKLNHKLCQLPPLFRSKAHSALSAYYSTGGRAASLQSLLIPRLSIVSARLASTGRSFFAPSSLPKKIVEEAGTGVQVEKKQVEVEEGKSEAGAKPSLYQRFKTIFKQYWYVAIPVHVVTSAMWFGSFYYAVTCGVDVLGVLEQIGLGELLKKIPPSAGHVAIAFAVYKIATPLRYAVTLGCSHLAIKYLSRMGYIKPFPTTKRMKEIVSEKRVQLNQYREKRARRRRGHNHKDTH